MRLSKDDQIEVFNGCLLVNKRPFVVEFPDEFLVDVDDGRLVTRFRGHLTNYWNVDDIEGYYA